MPHEVIGVDLGATEIKWTVLDVALRGLALKGVEGQPWPEPEEEAEPLPPEIGELAALEPETTEPQTAAPAEPPAPKSKAQILRALLHGGPKDHRGAEIYVGIDGRRTSTRLLQFPLGDLRKIEPLVAFELEDQLPRSLEEIVYVTTPVVQRKDHTTLFAAWADKKDVLDVAGVVGSEDAVARAIYCEPLALFALFPDAEGTGVIIDIGHTKTHLVLVKNGQIVFARTLREGGQRIDAALARAFNVSEAEARQGKERGARLLSDADTAPDPAHARVSEVIKEALKPLLTGIRQTILPHREHLGEACVLYLTGGQSQLPGLSEYLARELETPAQPLPLPMALAERPDGHRYALSYALAVTGASPPRAPRLDFRQGEFSFRGDLSRWREHLPILGVLTAAVVLLALVSAIARYSVLKADERALDRSLREVTKQTMGKEMVDFKQALAAIKQATNPTKSAIPRYSATDLFAQISDAVGKEIDVHTSEIDLRPDKIRIKGEAASFEMVDKVVDALRRQDCFKQVAPAQTRKTSDGQKVEFNLSIDVGCT